MSRTISIPAVVVLLCLTHLLGGCTIPAELEANSPPQETLLVYARVTDVTRTVEMELVKDFESRHNVRVTFVTGEDPDLYAKLVVEKENGIESADVIAGWNPVGILDLQERGWMVPYVPPELKSQIPQRFQDPVVIQHLGLVTLAYNPEKLGNTPPPTSFADLVDPMYRGKVALVDPIVSSTALKLVGHLALSTPLGWSYWEQLHANDLRLTGQWSQLIAEATDPSSPVAIIIAGYGLAYPALLAGEPLQTIVPVEGLIAGEYVVAVSTEAKYPELARAFVAEVTFHPMLLAAWANRYLPVTVSDLEIPEGTPSLEDVVITDWKLIQEKELEIKTQWQIIQSQ